MYNLAKKYPLQILYADDNPMDQLMLSRFFESLGYKIDIVCDGNQVLEVVNNKNYDILILDACMPLVDGIEAARIIRKRETESEKLLLVGLTAYDSNNRKESFLSAGADLYYKKPLELEDIVEIIETRCGEDIRTPV